MAATPHKAPTIWPPASHHESYSSQTNQTCRILLEKQGRVIYSYGPPHMAGQKQDDQLEHTYCSCVRIRDIALKTCQRRWTKGRSGERGSWISVLAARHDDDDDLKISFDWYVIISLRSHIDLKAYFSCIFLNQYIWSFTLYISLSLDSKVPEKSRFFCLCYCWV